MFVLFLKFLLAQKTQKTITYRQRFRQYDQICCSSDPMVFNFLFSRIFSWIFRPESGKVQPPKRQWRWNRTRRHSRGRKANRSKRLAYLPRIQESKFQRRFLPCFRKLFRYPFLNWNSSWRDRLWALGKQRMSFYLIHSAVQSHLFYEHFLTFENSKYVWFKLWKL